MNEVIEREAPALPVAPAVTPMALIERAMASGASMEQLEKLLDLQQRWEKNEARKAFDEAMAAAKADIPVIHKNREVDFTSQKGRTNYRYEDLAEIARTVDPILARHGLSYRFRTSSPPNEPVTVTCVIAHRSGHSEENTLCAGRDDSGNKNSIQAIGSTLTYLQRMTLKAALGLSASTDDDGRGAGGGEPVGLPEQAYADHLAAIEAAADADSLAKSWKAAAAACREHRDTEAHGKLKAVVAERGKKLKEAA